MLKVSPFNLMHSRLLVAMLAFAVSNFADAAEVEKLDAFERMEVGSTRLLISNYPTYQCGLRLVFDRSATTKKKDGSISLTVKTVPTEKAECGCKAHTNNFHLYRARRVYIGKDGMYIPDELVAKGRILPDASRTFSVAAIHRAERKMDYHIKFDCTD